jgi:hypothetical protein
MNTKIKLIPGLVMLALGALMVGSAAQADPIISNMTPTDTNQSAIANVNGSKGQQFTINSGSTDYTLNSADLKMAFDKFVGGISSNPDPGAAIPLLQLFSNNTSNLPGSALLTFTNPTFNYSTTAQNYTFVAPSAYTLTAGTSYWLVLSKSTASTDNVNRILWKGGLSSNAAFLPTGPGATAISSGNRFSGSATPPIGTSSNISQYTINATSNATTVPEIDALAGTAALAMLGFGLALAGERRRRAA